MRNVSVRYSVASRAVLLGLQYVFTVVLVVLSVYFSRHFDFLINTPPGFRTERILEADLQKENWNNRYTDEQRKTRNERIERIRKALDECPYIDSWICSSFDEITSEIQVNFFNEKDKKVSVKALFVPVAFFEFYGLKVLDGTLPDEIHDVTHSEIALNEEAMKLFGYADREEAFIRAEAPIWMFFGADGSVKKGGKYLKVLLASFVVAVPLAWFIIRRYTEGFVLKAPLSAWIFIVALLLVGLISLGTLGWQVGKAARVNPAEVMKSENN